MRARMYREDIIEQIERLEETRGKLLERFLNNDRNPEGILTYASEAVDDLKLYDEKIKSWRRLLEEARPRPKIRVTRPDGSNYMYGWGHGSGNFIPTGKEKGYS